MFEYEVDMKGYLDYNLLLQEFEGKNKQNGCVALSLDIDPKDEGAFDDLERYKTMLQYEVIKDVNGSMTVLHFPLHEKGLLDAIKTYQKWCQTFSFEESELKESEEKPLENYRIQRESNKFGFLVHIKDVDEYKLEFEIYKVTSEAEDENEEDYLEVERVVGGKIGWDEAIHLTYGTNGYVYLDDCDDVLTFNKSMEFVCKRAEKEFGDGQSFKKWKDTSFDIQLYNGPCRIKMNI